MENRQGLKNFSNTVTISKSELNAESFLLSLMVKIIFFVILFFFLLLNWTLLKTM